MGPIGAYAPGMERPDFAGAAFPRNQPETGRQGGEDLLPSPEPARRRVPTLLVMGLGLVIIGVFGLEFLGGSDRDSRVVQLGATPVASANPVAFRPEPALSHAAEASTPPTLLGSSVHGIPETLDDEVSVAAGPAYFDLPDLVQDDIDGVRLALGPSNSDGPEEHAASQGPDAFFQSWTRRGETLRVLYRMPSAQVVAFDFKAAHPWPPSGIQRIIAAQRLNAGNPAYTITFTHGSDDRKLCTGFLIKAR